MTAVKYEEAGMTCDCKFSDAWRCARDQRISGVIACYCPCHRRTEFDALLERIQEQKRIGLSAPADPGLDADCRRMFEDVAGKMRDYRTALRRIRSLDKKNSLMALDIAEEELLK